MVSLFVLIQFVGGGVCLHSLQLNKYVQSKAISVWILLKYFLAGWRYLPAMMISDSFLSR